MSPARADALVLRPIAKKLPRQFGTCSSPEHEVVAQEKSVCAGVCSYVDWVWTAIWEAMMGIGLAPAAAGCVAGVDIVAERLLLAPAQIRFLLLKPRIAPILFEGQYLGYAHRIYHVFFPIVLLRTGSHDPVSDRSCDADLRFTRRQGADAEKRIWRKSEISGDDVGMQPHEAQPYRLIGRGSRSSPEGPCHSFVFPRIAATTPSLFQPWTSSAYFSRASGTSHSFAPWA